MQTPDGPRGIYQRAGGDDPPLLPAGGPRLPEEKIFLIFLIGQALLWWLLPTLAFHNLPLDVVEGLAWGQNWPIGTYKHPPLQAWVLEIAALLGGRTDAGIYLTGAFSLAVTYWAVWRLGSLLLPPAQALAGVLALGGCFYFATVIPEFNPNVVQLPLYALCGLFFWRGCQHNRLRDWFFFGVCAGLGLWGKYSFILMIASFGLFVLLEREARQLLYFKGLWLAAAVAAAVFLPHFIWLATHGWQPLAYAQSRAEPAAHFGQTLFWIIAWLARGQAARRGASLRQRYLLMLAWGPFALLLALALLSGDKPRDMWGMALWPFIGLWLAGLLGSDWRRSRLARGVFFLAVAVMPLACLAGALLSTPMGYRPWRTEFPGRELAREAEALWRQQAGQRPLRIVISDNWFGGNVAWYSAARPQVMLFDQRNSPWVTPQMLAAQGGLVIWDARNGRMQPPDLALPDEIAGERKIVSLPFGNESMMVGLAVIKPWR